jgi:FdhD protein
MRAQAGSYETVVVMEDLGRSNSIDKALGWGLLNDLRFSNHLLFVTGRISSEMILKAYRAGIPALVSLTTMSSKAYEIAMTTGQTLVSHVLKSKPIFVNY